MISILITVMFLLSTASCNKFVEIAPPPTQISGTIIFNDDKTAIAAITGIYIRMMGPEVGFASGGLNSVTNLAGLSSDELTNYSFASENQEFNDNTISASNQLVSAYMWSEPYQYIYTTNSILEGLRDAPQISVKTRRQITGEANFIRAFHNFYLVNMFGDIPLDTTTAIRTNTSAKRTGTSEVYQKIIADLKEAMNNLEGDNSFSNGEKILPNKYVAMSLLSRVYLFNGDWVNAELLATEVINSNQYKLVTDLNSVFLANSEEAIWQLVPVVPGFNTWEGENFILNGLPSLVALNDKLVQIFEIGDQRKTKWIGSIIVDNKVYYFAHKYKIQTDPLLSEYSMVVRLAELYLIRAEARARLNNPTGALEDLNKIRNRAGLPAATVMDIPSILTAIEKERQKELFTEWGHRWFDLKRLNIIDSVLGATKPDWTSNAALYPIPQNEIQNNPGITQNPGY